MSDRSEIDAAIMELKLAKSLYGRAEHTRREARTAFDNAERERLVARGNLQQAEKKLLLLVGLDSFAKDYGDV